MTRKDRTTNKRRYLRGVDKTFIHAFSNYAPPEKLTVSQWAEKNRVLSRETSAEAGRWRNERTPYLVEIMDAFTDYKVKKISVVASSQVGKSECILNIIGYIIDQDPGTILFIQPNLDDAKKFSRLRVAPMIRDSKTLRKKVSDIKSRDSGNTMLQKSFAGGMLTIVGSNSPSALASTPAKYILGDERDRWSLSAGTEGDPWKLAEARTTTFYNSKMVDVSTPTIKGASAIEKSYNAGTRETWNKQCPCCDEWHNIVYGDIKFEYKTIKHGKKKDYIISNINWCCPNCGYLASEEEMRHQMGKWVAEYPEALERGHRSFWLNAFCSPWQSWEKIIYAVLTSMHDPKELQTVINTLRGELWEDRGDIEDGESLLSRREEYGRRLDGSSIDLPEGVLVLTCGVDTQDDRLEYEVVGHGHYGETWGIKKGVIMGDPQYPDVWERLDDVVAHTFKFKNPDKGLIISRTFVDSGGNKTQSVYKECAKRTHKRVFAIKGFGGSGIPYTRPPSKVKIMVKGRAIGKTWLYALGVDAGKSDIMSNIKVQEAGPKFCHFPIEEEKGYDISYFNGLLSEKLERKIDKGRTRLAWVKILGHERNEPLDCRNYALAAFRVLDPDLDAVERRLKELSQTQIVNIDKQPKQQNRVRKNNISDGGW